jgi:addiction module HigA family antidote
MIKINRKPTHPGEILREEFLMPLEISQTRLAEDLGIPFRIINEIVNEKRDITSELALKLSRYFSTSAELWLNLQNKYDIYSVLKNKRKEITKIRPYKASA